jgi:hypothetical protein
LSIEDRIVAVKRSAEPELLRRPGIHAVGVGLKFVNGVPTRELVIQVFVEQKRPLADLPEAERILDEIEGLKTDVIETPPAILATEDSTPYRPLKGGARIDVPPGVTIKSHGGTLGCIATTTDGQTVALSCHHVLFSPPSTFGSPVGQPDLTECGDCCNTLIGKVLRGIRTPAVDAAIAALNPGTHWLAEVVDIIGPIKGTHAVTFQEITETLGYPVKKRGRTTRLTSGRIVSLMKSGVAAKDENGVAWPYIDQMGINPDPPLSQLADYGDSGSVVINSDNEVVGLLWGMFPPPSIGGLATPITVVESNLEISIATASAEGVKQTVPGAPVSHGKAFSGGEGVHSFVQMNPGRGVEPFRIGSFSRTRLDALRQQGFDADRSLRHAEEIRALILTNPRVAAAWRRGRGPDMFRFLLAEQRVARSLESEPHRWPESLEPFLALLNRYGSAALCSDLPEFRRVLAFIERQSDEAESWQIA